MFQTVPVKIVGRRPADVARADLPNKLSLGSVTSDMHLGQDKPFVIGSPKG